MSEMWADAIATILVRQTEASDNAAKMAVDLLKAQLASAEVRINRLEQRNDELVRQMLRMKLPAPVAPQAQQPLPFPVVPRVMPEPPKPKRPRDAATMGGP